MQKISRWFLISATVLVLTACGGGGSGGDDPIVLPAALEQIADYAKNGGTAPSVKTYVDAGITGVTAANLDEINAVVIKLNYEDVDEKAEVQALADELGLEVDTTAPVFTSGKNATVAENQTSAITLVATGAIAYSINGGESSSFDMNSTTGVVTFKVAPDFETLATYAFTATARDSAGNVSTQDVTITISNVAEGQAPKKTGQTKSYNEAGTEVLDNSIKDDGFYQAGTTPSYTRDDATEIVTDHITGLEWADDAAVATVTKPWLTQTNYDICTGENGQTQDTSKCTDTSGDTATTYCNTLTLGGFSDWRLPNIDELMYIADRSKRNPAIDTTVFENVVSNFYWSSNTVVGIENSAWNVHFYDGYDGWNFKSNSVYVRCVRVGQ